MAIALKKSTLVLIERSEKSPAHHAGFHTSAQPTLVECDCHGVLKSSLFNLRGMGLIEIMISSLLASLLLFMLMQHYWVSKGVYQQAHGLMQTELELQLVSDLIRDSIRQAGFTPCLPIGYLQTIDRRKGTPLFALGRQVGQAQALQINHMSADFSSVLGLTTTNQLIIQPQTHYKVGQTILIADCYHAEVQLITAMQAHAEGVLITVARPLAFAYTRPLYLGEWLEETFFIQKNSQGKPGLFYQINHAEELTNLVHKLDTHVHVGQGKTWIEVVLGLDKQQEYLIEASLRTS